MKKRGVLTGILAVATTVLIVVNLVSAILGMRAAASSFIRWVSFTPTLAALDKAYKTDVETNKEEYHLKTFELLAYYSALKGDGYKSFDGKVIDDLVERLKNGEKFEEISGKLKNYSYYRESYEAVLGEFTGDFTENKEKKYGLKVYSPIALGYYYSHTSDFGNGRSFGFNRKHLGNDLFGSVGTPIVSVESGIVEEVGWNRYGGWRVGVRSFDGKRYYYYAHLRRDHPYNADIKIGEVVSAGEVLGYLGATGYSDKENVNGMKVPHLHFGMQLIFDESQKDGNGEIWIDVYNIVRFLSKHKSEVTKNNETGEYERKYEFYEKNLDNAE